MPFTPFHFGPGAAVKAMAGQHFSFTVFAFTQVAIDLEPLYFMLRDEDPLHRFFHTYVGATAVALVSVLIGRPICEWALRVWNSGLSPAQARWLAFPPTISLASAAIGAFIGAYSHIALDSVMHADMRPLAPFVESNSFLGVVSIDDLHGICVIAGLVGLAVLYAKRVWERWVTEAEQPVVCMARALDQGGRFVVELGGKGNIAAITRAVREAVWEVLRVEVEYGRYYPTVSEYSGLVEQHGLLVRSAVLFDRPTKLEAGEQGLRNWIAMFDQGVMSNVPDDKKEQVIRKVEG